MNSSPSTLKNIDRNFLDNDDISDRPYEKSEDIDELRKFFLSLGFAPDKDEDCPVKYFYNKKNERLC